MPLAPEPHLALNCISIANEEKRSAHNSHSISLKTFLLQAASGLICKNFNYFGVSTGVSVMLVIPTKG